MENNFVEECAKRNSKNNIVVFSIILVVLIAAIVLCNQSVMTSLIKPMDVTSLADIEEIMSHQSVAIYGQTENQSYINTGYYITDKESDKKKQAVYVTLMGDKYVMALYNSKAEFDPDILGENGKILLTYEDSDDIEDFNGLRKAIAEDMTEILGEKIYTSDFAEGIILINAGLDCLTWQIIWGAVIIGCIALIVLIIREFANRGNLQKSKLYRELCLYGDGERMVQEVNKEVAMQPLKLNRNILLTKNWIIQARKGKTIPIRLDSMIWVYPHITESRYGKSYDIYFNLKNGKCKIIEVLTEQNSNEVMNALAQAVPWVILGYDADYKKMWNKDREAMEKEVMARKASQDIQF